MSVDQLDIGLGDGQQLLRAVALGKIRNLRDKSVLSGGPQVARRGVARMETERPATAAKGNHRHTVAAQLAYQSQPDRTVNSENDDGAEIAGLRLGHLNP